MTVMSLQVNEIEIERTAVGLASMSDEKKLDLSTQKPKSSTPDKKVSVDEIERVPGSPPAVPASHCSSQSNCAETLKAERLTISPVEVPAKPKNGLSVQETLGQKLKFFKTLLQVDRLASCLIILYTVLRGGINCMKTFTETQLSACLLELIVTHSVNKSAIFSLLIRHLILHIISFGLWTCNAYARRKLRRPFQKKLHVELMEAFASLSYELMLNKKTTDDFYEVGFCIIMANFRP
jgi:hypothetical protein